MVKKSRLELIGVEKEIKKQLNSLKKYPRDTYNDIIVRLIKNQKEVKKNE